jgi:hypothetical protein
VGVLASGSVRMIVDAGGMAEWSMAVVLKTTKVQAFGGSNPSPSVFRFRPLAAIPLVS